jgi:hypothetical protein
MFAFAYYSTKQGCNPVIAPPSYDTLPDELLLLIFGFLPIKYLGFVACVSKKWASVSNDEGLWKAKWMELDGSKKKEGETWRSLAIRLARFSSAFMLGKK